MKGCPSHRNGIHDLLNHVPASGSTTLLPSPEKVIAPWPKFPPCHFCWCLNITQAFPCSLLRAASTHLNNRNDDSQKEIQKRPFNLVVFFMADGCGLPVPLVPELWARWPLRCPHHLRSKATATLHSSNPLDKYGGWCFVISTEAHFIPTISSC